ncbi:hypothetical protein M5D96_001530, partial [Drosophila gunungcola]
RGQDTRPVIASSQPKSAKCRVKRPQSTN